MALLNVHRSMFMEAGQRPRARHTRAKLFHAFRPSWPLRASILHALAACARHLRLNQFNVFSICEQAHPDS